MSDVVGGNGNLVERESLSGGGVGGEKETDNAKNFEVTLGRSVERSANLLGQSREERQRRVRVRQIADADE